MKWLKAELEIRGYSRCVKRPKRCKKEIERIVEDCKRGDCFVDPAKVIEEAREVLAKEDKGVTLTQIAVGILAILLILNLVGLYTFYNKLSETMKEITMLKRDIENLKWNVRVNSFKVDSINAKVNDLAKKISGFDERIEALKIAIFYLNKR